MPSKDCASKDYPTLEAEVDKGEPSRLLIEIALRPPSFPAVACDPGEVQRAIRDGFREVLTQLELERLARMSNPRRSRARRWIGRAVAFVVSAAIGSVATVLLSAPHVRPPDAVGALTPPLADPGLAAMEAPKPGSQSSAVPAVSGAASAQAAQAPAGPGTFGLNEQ